MFSYFRLKLMLLSWLISPLLFAQDSGCAGVPGFIEKFGFNLQTTAISTDETNVVGLCLVDVTKRYTYAQKPFQHETWDDAGYLATIVRNRDGSCYVIPVPVVNNLKNPPLLQNIIYKVDGQTGVMRKHIELPAGDKNISQNPYGLLGLTNDCDNNFFYAASVYHSDRANERGVIYSLDINTKEIIDKIENIDAMGLQVWRNNGIKKLLIGKARSSDVYSVEVSPNGKFVGQPKLEFTINNLGPRGDDRVRKFKIDPSSGDLLVFGTEFYFNLIAPSKDQSSTYRFRYNDSSQTWKFVGIEKNAY
ncbi:MAG: hypothetical protein KDD49_07185 [Bacteroidetes bacterium]|nr:hypothetical protein [Bacteroidota bacterium]